uniref:Dynactin subunit 6 n=11 Tax=Passeriformes TaxID=9126 RepID=A0A674GRK3_TAEGU
KVPKEPGASKHGTRCLFLKHEHAGPSLNPQTRDSLSLSRCLARLSSPIPGIPGFPVTGERPEPRGGAAGAGPARAAPELRPAQAPLPRPWRRRCRRGESLSPPSIPPGSPPIPPTITRRDRPIAPRSVKIAPGAVVCVESEIRGDVTIGPRTVIHPKARIIAEAGPIVIGEGNLIEEQALIINGYPENITPESEDVEPKPMVIGTNNVFEVGCYSQAMKVGDNNVIESKAFVGRNVILTSGCIIGACCNVNTYEVIPENTVIYGADCLRRVQTERPQPQTLQLDFLMKILPNYHHLKKTMKAASTPVKS